MSDCSRSAQGWTHQYLEKKGGRTQEAPCRIAKLFPMDTFKKREILCLLLYTN